MVDVIEYELPDDSESDYDASSGSSGTDVRFRERCLKMQEVTFVQFRISLARR